MSTQKSIPLDAWQQACTLAADAVRVSYAYDNLYIWFVPLTQTFLVASKDAGVKELAERFIINDIETKFAYHHDQRLMSAVADHLNRMGGKTND